MRLFLFALGFLFACLFYGTADLFHRANLKEVVMRILLSALLSLLLVACASVGGPNAGGVPLYVYVSEPAPDGGGRDAIILWSEAPPQCRSFDPEAKRATYHFRKVVADNPHVSGLVLEGCYVIRNGFVAMSFINGARGANPFGDFKPAQDGKTEPERAA